MKKKESRPGIFGGLSLPGKNEVELNEPNRTTNRTARKKSNIIKTTGQQQHQINNREEGALNLSFFPFIHFFYYFMFFFFISIPSDFIL